MRTTSTDRYRFVIAWLTVPARFCYGIIASAGPLLPLIMADLSISRGTAGWFVSAPQIMMTAFSVPAGILANRIGLKKTFAIGFFLEAVGILTPFCVSYPTLLVTRVLFGIGAAMTNPLASGIIAQWFSSKELPLVNGLTQSGGSVGNTLAYYVSVPLAVLISWRWALGSYSLVALISAILWTILGRERPRVVVTVPRDRTLQSPPTRASPPVRKSTRQILMQKETLALALGVFGPFCLYIMFAAWLPAYYYEVFKMPLAQASYVTAIFKLVGIPSVILGGILPTRLGVRKPIIVISGLMVGITGLATFMFRNPVIIFTALAIYGVFGVIYMPSVLTIPMELPE